jgi:hypothetical protein
VAAEVKGQILRPARLAEISCAPREIERSPIAASGENEHRSIRALVKMSCGLVFKFFRRDNKPVSTAITFTIPTLSLQSM